MTAYASRRWYVLRRINAGWDQVHKHHVGIELRARAGATKSNRCQQPFSGMPGLNIPAREYRIATRWHSQAVCRWKVRYAASVSPMTGPIQAQGFFEVRQNP